MIMLKKRIMKIYAQNISCHVLICSDIDENNHDDLKCNDIDENNH